MRTVPFCLQAARLVFVRYTLCFRSTWLRMFPFNYSPPHSLFLLSLEGKLHNMVEKNSSHGKGGSTPFTISVSGFTLFEGEKMNQHYWKQMLTLCQLLRMGRVDSVVAVTKRYWRQSGTLWWITFPSVRGQQKLHGTKYEVTLWF